MRILLSALGTLTIAAASPAADKARALLEAGDDRRAFEAVADAPSTRDPDGIQVLAWMYDEGRAVLRDDARAAALYERAAELGHAWAQWRLGVMLDTGEGVAPNPEEAVRWFRASADQGEAYGFVSLAVMHATGRGVPADFAEARRLYLEAARRGAAHGFYGVGVLYVRGEGVEADMTEALAWMFAAAALGDEEAGKAAESFGLSDEDTRRAAERAQGILREYGYSNHQVRFRNLDREGAGPER